jgi:hypothetical protein
MTPLRLAVGLLLFSATAGAQETKALFLGNSYTNANGLVGMVQSLAAANGVTLTKDKNTPGGNTLGAPQSNGHPHKSNPTSLAKIAATDWDFVVLQEQSYLPTLSYPKTQYMFTGVQSLDASIEANDPGTEVLLFQTWGRRDGGSFCWGGCVDFADFDEMQDALTQAYDECAALIGARVVPVGEAWRLARALEPGIVLHSGDGSHPNLSGSYLAASVFYAVIFDASPVGLAYTAGLDPRRALLLQEVAEATVFCGLETSCVSAPNSAGAGARIASNGTASIHAADLQLTVSGAIPTDFGLFFYGSASDASPFGDGFSCTSAPLFRLGPASMTDGLGANSRTLDYDTPPMNSGAGAVAPGVSWSFQYWYRDSAGSGGSGFNVSDSLIVRFCP